MFDKDRNRMISFTDWSEEMLRSIRVPVLIISGDREVAIAAHNIKMWKLIADSKLLILPATH